MAISLSHFRVPIAQLGPNLESADSSSVHGIVTLVWPYASSNQSLSLLLVEPDFRLRRQRGQVRIHFQGSSARAVAKARVSSGDELVLNLRGASWEKDSTTADTPGRGVEWELSFGERVVLEIQRPGQRPILLEVDHPPSSPEAPRQISSPLSSPSYNSHIPSSARKTNLESLGGGNNTWSSPAFLKRTHVGTSTYDPFAELDEEFPDNERKKRTKFGRGSGHWRFVGNTPSPEKEHEENARQDAPPSALEAMQVGAGQDVEEQVILATRPMDASVSVPQDSRSLGTEVMASTTARLSNVDTTTNVNANTSFNEGPALNRQEQPSILDEEINQFAPPGSANLEPASNAVQAFPRDSSRSIASSRRQSTAAESGNSEEEEHARDSASDAVWSGTASEFGLDGAVVSKLRQVPQAVPMASKIGRRWVEMQEAASNRERVESIIRASGAESSPALGRDSVSEDGVAPQLEYTHFKYDAQQRSSVPLADLDQRLETVEPLREEARSMEDNGKDVQMEEVRNREMANIGKVQSTQPELTKKATTEQDVQLEDGATLSTRLEVDNLESDGETTLEEAMANEEVRVTESLPATIKDSVAFPEPFTQPPPSSRVEVINLEGDDEEDDQQNLPISIQDASRSLYFGIAKDQWTDPFCRAGEVTKRDDIVEEELGARTDKVSTAFEAQEIELDDSNLDRVKAALDSMEEYTPISQEERGAVLEEEPPVNPKPITDDLPPQDISLEPVDNGDQDKGSSYPQLLPGLVSQDPLANVEILLPNTRFSSTVQDKFEDTFTSQLLTPDDTQQIDLVPQPSEMSMLSSPKDETLPTPGATQRSHAGNIVPEPKVLESTGDEPNQTQAPELTAPEVQAELHDLPIQKDPNQTSPEELKPEIPAVKAVDQESTGKGASLISRLKEMRRLSSRTPRKRLSGSSARPWFSPRRSSQTVPDSEAWSDVHASSTERAEQSEIKIITKVTPEKAEKRLSQSFIRSSPLHSSPSKSPSSSQRELQYIPHSQPATGFRTGLSYFVPLASLHSNYGTSVDVLAVAISSTSVTRAISGPRHYNQTIYLTDPSAIATKTPNTLTTAQIFRPRKNCFPNINIGDALLLRNFKVQSFQKSLSLISTDSSGWAVFRKDTDVQIPGPPVEYGPEERAFARALWNWWASLEVGLREALVDALPKAKINSAKKEPTKKGLGFELPSSQPEKATKKSKLTDESLPVSFREQSSGLDGLVEPGSTKEEKAASQRRVLRPRNVRDKASASPEKDAVPRVEEIHELRDGTRYVDRKGFGVGEVETQNGLHELRDGTRYRDRIRK